MGQREQVGGQRTLGRDVALDDRKLGRILRVLVNVPAPASAPKRLSRERADLTSPEFPRPSCTLQRTRSGGAVLDAPRGVSGGTNELGLDGLNAFGLDLEVDDDNQTCHLPVFALSLGRCVGVWKGSRTHQEKRSGSATRSGRQGLSNLSTLSPPISERKRKVYSFSSHF